MDLPDGFEAPDNFWDDMPDDTYCKCGGTSVMKSAVVAMPLGFKYNVRIKCNACGFWTDAVPTSSR